MKVISQFADFLSLANPVTSRYKGANSEVSLLAIILITLSVFVVSPSVVTFFTPPLNRPFVSETVPLNLISFEVPPFVILVLLPIRLSATVGLDLS